MTELTNVKAIRTYLELNAEPIQSSEFMVFYKEIPKEERPKMAQDAIDALNAAGGDYTLAG